MAPRHMFTLLLSLALLAPLPAAAADPDPDAAFAQAERFKSIAEYAMAAERYEDAAARFPAAPAAIDAWNDAVIFRLALGDIERATQDADTFEKLYGRKRPVDVVKLRLGITSVLLERRDFAGARKRLERLLPQVDRFGRLGERIDAHTWLGRSLLELGDARGAEREFGLVRAMWSDPEAATKQFVTGGDDEPAQLRRLGRALTAVGEAVFFFAERRRAEADAIRFPEYRGPARREQILMHLGTPVAEWIRKRRAAIEAAEGAYTQVLSLQPAPPPRWVIASGARVGQMWSTFVEELRGSRLPAAWKASDPVPGLPGTTYGELRELYKQTIGELSEPLKQRAKAAFRTCLAYSVKYQYADEHTRSCEAWLTRNYRSEFPPIEELQSPLAGAVWSLVPAPLPDPRP